MVPLKIFTTIIGFFTGKHKAWAWGIIILAALGLFGWWSLSTIDGLKKENHQIALKMENANLKDTIKVQDQERQAFQEKVDGIAETVEKLNKQYSKNYVQRQSDVNSMIGQVERDDQGKINTQTLQDKANNGMNKLFNDLETLSKNETK